MTNRMPAETVAPGEFLREEIEARGWTQETFAEVLGKSVRLVNEILMGRRSITPETATVLGQALGTSAELWLNLESTYQLSRVASGGDVVARRSKLYSKAPVKDMIKRHWIERSSNIEVLEQRVADFFGVRSIDEDIEPVPHAARKSASYESTSPTVCAWLTMARRMARCVAAKPYTEARLKEGLNKLRPLLGSAEEVRHVPAILAEAGIRMVIVEHLPQSKIDGAALWLDKAGKQPVVALSLRYDRVDCFWFTLVHELMHIRHRDVPGQSEYAGYDVELVGQGARKRESLPKIEQARNREAAAFLVPQAELDDFIVRVGPLYSKKRIVEFAEAHNLHPGLVVGQLQFRGELDWTHSREMLERVRGVIAGTALTDGWGHTA